MANGPVEIKNVFPCATAPFDATGAKRLFTEDNITALFSFIFDIDPTKDDYCIISNDGKRLVFNGYMFTAADNSTFSN